MPGDYASRRSRTRDKTLCFEHDVTGDGDRKRIRINQRVDPADGVDARISAREPDGYSYDGRLPALDLPASGEMYDDCGDTFHGLFCPCFDCLETQEIGRTCRRSRCPRCYKAWAAFERAKTWVAKIEGLRAKREQTRSGWQKFHHLVVSFRPDAGFRSDDPVKQARKVTQAVLEHLNVDTGLAVYHPYRIAPEYRGDVTGHEPGDGDLRWKDILSEKLEHPDWPVDAIHDEFLIREPHFHVYTVSDFVDSEITVPEINDTTGLTIKRVTECDGNASLRTIDDLARSLIYAISHVGLEQRNSSYRARMQAFGELHNHAAEDWAKKKADKAVRKATPDVLGLKVAEPTCDAPVKPEETASESESTPERSTAPGTSPLEPTSATTNVRPNGGGGSSLQSSSSSNDLSGSSEERDGELNKTLKGDPHEPEAAASQPVPDWVNEPPVDADRCGSSLRPIRTAPTILSDDEIRSKIETTNPDGLENLGYRYDEYQNLKSSQPTDDPPPTDGNDEPPD